MSDNAEVLTAEQQLQNEIKLLCYIKAQAFARRFIARKQIHKILLNRFEKIRDPKQNKFYFYDRQLDVSSWEKPKIFRGSDIDEIAPTYIPDEAALMIQRQLWRTWASRRVRGMYKAAIKVLTDKTTGKAYYLNEKTSKTMWKLPLFMGGKLDHDNDIEERKEKLRKERLKKLKTTSIDEIGDAEDLNDDDSSIISKDDEGDDDESDIDEDSVVMREKRKLKRKYPRSRVQEIVDFAEDNINDTYELDISGLRAKYFTSRIYDLVDLVSINLSNNQLTHLSTNIQFLSKLELIDCSNNKISKIPREIEDLKLLREFIASKNRLSSYPATFYKLGNMEVLDLSYNNFEVMPMEIGNLELLKDLGEWEVGIGLLKNLYSLNLSFNKLSAWIPQLERLTSIQNLQMQGNQLEVIPSDISSHPYLSHLNLSENKITCVPPELLDLQSLQQLYLEKNSLTSLPDFILGDQVGLTSLVELNISNNSINCLNDFLGSLVTLQTFNASYNKISNISEAIESMKSLRILDLSHNEIESFPDEFAACKLITKLDISYNRLTELPIMIHAMSTLKTLDASNNLLSEVPGKIFALSTAVVEVDLHNNQIVQLPRSLFGCKKLKKLCISHNRIKQFHSTMGGMSSLESLIASFNEIESLPDSFAQLTELKIIELHCNDLKVLPEDTSQLSKVTRFTLEKNDFLLSPHQLFLLPNLISWNLSWNNRIVGQFIDWKSGDQKFLANRARDKATGFTNQLIPSATLQRSLRDSCLILDELNEQNRSIYRQTSIEKEDYFDTKPSPFLYLEATLEKIEIDENKSGNTKYMTKMTTKLEGLKMIKETKQHDAIVQMFQWEGRLKTHFQELFDSLLNHRVSHASPTMCLQANNLLQSIEQILPRNNTEDSNCGDLIKLIEDKVLANIKARQLLDNSSSLNDMFLKLNLCPNHLTSYHAPGNPVEDFLEIFKRLDLGYQYIDVLRTFEDHIHEIYGLAMSEYYLKMRTELIGQLLNNNKNKKGDDDKPNDKVKTADANPPDHDFKSSTAQLSPELFPELISAQKLLNFHDFPRIISHIWFLDSRSDLYERAVDCYLGLGNVLHQLALKYAQAIREVEFIAKWHVSSMTIAERVCEDDYTDLICDGMDSLRESMKALTKSTSVPKIGNKKRDKMASLLSITRNLIESADIDALEAGTARGKEEEANKPSEDDSKSKPVDTKKKSGGAASEKEKQMGKVTFTDALKDDSNKNREPPPPAPVIPEEPKTLVYFIRQLSHRQQGTLLEFLKKMRELISLYALLSLEFTNEMMRRCGYDDYNHFYPKKSCKKMLETEATSMLFSAQRMHYYRGKTFQGLKQFDKAIVSFRTVLSLTNNKMKPAQIELIKSYLSNGDYIIARDLLEVVIRKEFKANPRLYSDGPDGRLRIDEIEVWKGNRLLSYLLIYCRSFCNEIAKCQVGEVSQWKQFIVAPDGLLLPNVWAPADVKHGSTPTRLALIEERYKVKAETEEQIQQEQDDEALLRRLQNVSFKYKSALVVVAQDIERQIVITMPREKGSSSSGRKK